MGYGGHTSHMLACLKGEGHMYALDVDTIEMEKPRKRLADKGFGPDILTTVSYTHLPPDEPLKADQTEPTGASGCKRQRWKVPY